MQPIEDASAPDKSSLPPEKKHNLGAKIGVALTMGIFVGGKVATPFTVLDVNELFPKNITLREKIKRTFSREIFELLDKAIVHERQVNGRGPVMAWLAASKWSTLAFAASCIGLAVLGWQRAGRIQDSKDIIHHPLKSTKIIFGFQEPDAAPAPKKIQGKYTSAVTAERSEVSETQIER